MLTSISSPFVPPPGTTFEPISVPGSERFTQIPYSLNASPMFALNRQLRPDGALFSPIFWNESPLNIRFLQAPSHSIELHLKRGNKYVTGSLAIGTCKCFIKFSADSSPTQWLKSVFDLIVEVRENYVVFSNHLHLNVLENPIDETNYAVGLVVHEMEGGFTPKKQRRTNYYDLLRFEVQLLSTSGKECSRYDFPYRLSNNSGFPGHYWCENGTDKGVTLLSPKHIATKIINDMRNDGSQAWAAMTALAHREVEHVVL